MFEIEEKALVALLRGSTDASCAIKTIEDGFCIVIHSRSNDGEEPDTEFILHRKLGGIRTWKSLDKIFDYIDQHEPNWETIKIIR